MQIALAAPPLAAAACCSLAAATRALFLAELHDVFLSALFRLLGEYDPLFGDFL